MSRILMLLPSDPSRRDAGARIRNAGLIDLLSADHQVDTLIFGEPPARSPKRRLADMARSDLPDMAQRLWSPTFATDVECRLRTHDYAAVQAEGIEMARYLQLVPPAQRVYDAHNAEFLLQRRFATSFAPTALYSRVQWRRLERFEGGLVRSSRLTLAVSDHDANQLLALGGPCANVHVLPNAIDVDAYPFRPPTDPASGNFLFLGKLDYRPNVDALAWFIPEVLRHLSDARLFAVGSSPPAWLVATGQHDDRVAVTGHVADERPYFARCDALVLPVRSGAGSRLKALVAMASGVPIVSTRFGMEGLEAEPGTHYLVADSAEEWVAVLRRLLEDAPLRSRLACNARELVERSYTWATMRDRLRAAYAWLIA